MKFLKITETLALVFIAIPLCSCATRTGKFLPSSQVAPHLTDAEVLQKMQSGRLTNRDAPPEQVRRVANSSAWSSLAIYRDAPYKKPSSGFWDILGAISAGICSASFYNNSTYVAPYIRKDGTFVSGHYRTNPDGSRFNNWSYYGNVNPYTGEIGDEWP